MPGSYYSDVERTIYLTYYILMEDTSKYDELFQQARVPPSAQQPFASNRTLTSPSLNAQMDDYIKVSNTKRYGVYRDIIIPEEYDPLTPHEAIIHYANPTKYDARNYGAIRRNSAQFCAIL